MFVGTNHPLAVRIENPSQSLIYVEITSTTGSPPDIVPIYDGGFVTVALGERQTITISRVKPSPACS